MKKLLLLLLFAIPLYGQGARFEDNVVQAATVAGVPNVITAVGTAQINLCVYPVNAVPCMNKATTYPLPTLTSACSTAQQITIPGSSSCTSTTDAYGNWGVWVPPGTYSYTITIAGVNLGPYTFTAGAVGNGGIINVSTPPSGACTPGSTAEQDINTGLIYTCQNGVWTSIGGAGTLPAIPIASSTTMAFAASTNVAYIFTLGVNVTTTSITGTPQNGNLLKFHICQPGIGGPYTFTFPTGFLNTTTIQTTDCTDETYSYDSGSGNWSQLTQPASGGGGGGGACSSSGAQGTLQAAATAGACQPTSVVDNSTTVSTTEPLAALSLQATGTTGSTQCAHFDTTGLLVGTGADCFSGGGTPGGTPNDSQCNVANAFSNCAGTTANVRSDEIFYGPMPYMDARAFGARATVSNVVPSIPGITAVITSTQNTAVISTNTCASQAGGVCFKIGDGVTIIGAGGPTAISTPAAPTVTPANAVGATNSGLVVTSPSGSTSYQMCLSAVGFQSQTACSAFTSISTGQATLGPQTSTAASATNSNGVMTVVTNSALPVNIGATCQVYGMAPVSYNYEGPVRTVSGTTLTFATQNDTRNGAQATASSLGSVTCWNSVHVKGTKATGATASTRYAVYGGAGSATDFLGFTTIPGNLATNDATYLVFDWYGATYSPKIMPYYIAAIAPSVATNESLTTTITNVSGTTLTLADPAVTSVPNATSSLAGNTLLDQAPTIHACLAASVIGTPCRLAAGSGEYVLNSQLTIPNKAVLEVTGKSDTGGLNVNDTILFAASKSELLGLPASNQSGDGSFEHYANPTIRCIKSWPCMEAFDIAQLNNFEVDMFDGGLGFFSSAVSSFGSDWSNIYWNMGQGYGSIAYYCQGNHNGGGLSDVIFRNHVFYANQLGLGSMQTPAFYANGCGTWTFPHTYFSGKQRFWRATTTGINIDIEQVEYSQAAYMPYDTIYNVDGGNINAKVYQHGTFVPDTTFAPLLATNSGITANLISDGATPAPSGTITTGNGVINFHNGPSGGSGGQNLNQVLDITQYFMGDPILGYANKGAVLHDADLTFAPLYSVHTIELAPAAPTCAPPTSGGSVPVGAFNYTYSYVYPDGGQGTPSLGCAATTTGGNQTVIVTAPALAGAKYVFFRDGLLTAMASCVPQTSNSFTDTFSFGCGPARPNWPSSGPVGIKNTQAWSKTNTIMAYQDYAAPTAPANPPAGIIRTYQDPGTGKWTCKDSAGANCGSAATSVTTLTGDGSLITNSGSSGPVTLTLGAAGAYNLWFNNTAGSAIPTYTALSALPIAQFPTLNQNTTGTAANLGACSASSAGDICIFGSGVWTKLAGNVSGTQVLQENASGVASWGSGASTTFQANGTPLTSSATVNFQDSSAFNGLTATFTNPSAGNVKLGFSGTLGNAGLTNSTTTVNSQSCALGGTCTIPIQTNTVNNTSQAGINLIPSTVNATGITVTPTNTATNQVTFEETGTVNSSHGGTGQNLGASTGVAQVAAGVFSVSTGLANGTTATLQSCADATTKVATDSFVATCGLINPMTTIGDMLGGGASGAATRIVAGKTGQSIVATNAATPTFASGGISDGNGGAVVTSTPYVVLCDSATAVRDRLTVIRVQSGGSVVTNPDHTATGCGNNFAYTIFADGVTVTVNRGGTDTFSIFDGSAATDGATSFTLLTGQYATINNGTAGIWEVRKTPSSVGTVTSIATTTPITGGTITTTGTVACPTCVTSAAALTSTALMTGAALQASQTPSATSTLDASGNMVLAGTITATATTQAAKDNSTKLATTAYVDRSTPLTTGTSVTLSAPRQYFVCTGTCTITVPVPAAGNEFCVMNDDNVATVITMSAIGSSARYENTSRTAYGTAGTGTFVSGGATGDKVCILGRDATHYLTVSFNGTWTAN